MVPSDCTLWFLGFGVLWCTNDLPQCKKTGVLVGLHQCSKAQIWLALQKPYWTSRFVLKLNQSWPIEHLAHDQFALINKLFLCMQNVKRPPPPSPILQKGVACEQGHNTTANEVKKKVKVMETAVSVFPFHTVNPRSVMLKYINHANCSLSIWHIYISRATETSTSTIRVTLTPRSGYTLCDWGNTRPTSTPTGECG